MDENRPKEKGQPVMEETLRSPQQTATQAARQAAEQELKISGSQAFETSCTEAASSAVTTPIQEGREGCRSGLLECRLR